MEKKYAGLCVKFYSSYRESPTRRGNIVTSCFAARHWINRNRWYPSLRERSSIYRLHRRNLICNREFLIQPLSAKSILQLDWVINYYRLYNAVKVFFSSSTFSSYFFFFFLFIFNIIFIFNFFQLYNENKKEIVHLRLLLGIFIRITTNFSSYLFVHFSFVFHYLDHVNKFPFFIKTFFSFYFSL